jgi:hypothetical protein
VLLRTPRLTYGAAGAAHDEDFHAWADTFAARGYTAVEVDVTVTPPAEAQTASASGSASANGSENGSEPHDHIAFPEPIASAKRALNAQLRLLNIPFAPVLIASGPAGLVAQAYVSDHAASGLVLLDPPADEDPRRKDEAEATGWAWPKFNYEPRFPILLMGEGEAVEGSRVGKAAAEGVRRGGQGVSVERLVDGVRGEKTRMVSSSEGRRPWGGGY